MLLVEAEVEAAEGGLGTPFLPLRIFAASAAADIPFLPSSSSPSSSMLLSVIDPSLASTLAEKPPAVKALGLVVEGGGEEEGGGEGTGAAAEEAEATAAASAFAFASAFAAASAAEAATSFALVSAAALAAAAAASDFALAFVCFGGA